MEKPEEIDDHIYDKSFDEVADDSSGADAQRRERREKLNKLRKLGVAFPNDFARSDLAATLHAAHDTKTNEQLEAGPIEVAIAGRMMLKRVMGKASFATL